MLWQGRRESENVEDVRGSAIAGMKDSSGDWNNTKTFLDALAVRAGRAASRFDVFVGSESFLLANMQNGGVGTISATANVNPAAIYELYVECIRNQTADIGDQTSNIKNGTPTGGPKRRA